MAQEIVLYAITAGLSGVGVLGWRMLVKVTKIEGFMEKNDEDHKKLFGAQEDSNHKIEELAERVSKIEGILEAIKNGSK